MTTVSAELDPRPTVAAGAGLPLAAAALAAAASTSAILGLPAVMPQLIEAFGISYARAGLIVTVLWVPHALSQAAGGWWGHTAGVGRLLRWSLAGLAGLLALSLVAPSYPVLVGLRIATGGATGAVFVLAVLFAAEQADPAAQRGPQALVGAAAYVGCAVAYAAIALIQGVAGWRAGYLPTLVFVLCALVLFPAAPPPRAGREAAHARLPLRSAWPLVWRGRVAVLAMAHLCSFGIFVVVASWLTAYFVRRGDLGAAGNLYVGAAVLAAGALGRFAGGALLGRVGDRALVMEALACSGAALAALAFSPSFPVAVALAGLVLAICSVTYGSVVALALGGRPPAEAGAAVAWMLLLSNLCGAGLPAVVGWLVDATGSFGPGFALLAGLTGVAVAALPLHPQPAPDGAPAAGVRRAVAEVAPTIR